MNGYSVEAKSRKDLRIISNFIRKSFKLERAIYVPIVDLLDVFSETIEGFSYEIVENNCFPCNVHAETNIKTGEIQIKESVYEGACKGNGRDRMTIAHEVGHFLTICLFGFKLHRDFSSGRSPYRDPERQAKCFAAELLISKELVRNLSVDEIACKCGVSKEAAKYQKDIYMKEDGAM